MLVSQLHFFKFLCSDSHNEIIQSLDTWRCALLRGFSHLEVHRVTTFLTMTHQMQGMRSAFANAQSPPSRTQTFPIFVARGASVFNFLIAGERLHGLLRQSIQFGSGRVYFVFDFFSPVFVADDEGGGVQIAAVFARWHAPDLAKLEQDEAARCVHPSKQPPSGDDLDRIPLFGKP